MPVAVQRKEQSAAQDLYNQIKQAMESGQPRLLELHCEKEESKRISLLTSESSRSRPTKNRAWWRQQAPRLQLRWLRRTGAALAGGRTTGFTWPTGHRALNHCNFRFPPGLWMLVGGNGCGKSTLLADRWTPGTQPRPVAATAQTGTGLPEPRSPTPAAELRKRHRARSQHLTARSDRPGPGPRAGGTGGFRQRPIHSLSGAKSNGSPSLEP